MDQATEPPAPGEAAPQPWDAAAEYDEILSMVRHARPQASPADGEAYQQLLAKEQRVLDTVDRVVNDARRVEISSTSFTSIPLHEAAMRTMAALRGLMDDLLASRSAADVAAALAKEDRRIYLGVCLLAIGFLLAFVQATGGVEGR